MKKTKVLCTIGTASMDTDLIKKMFDAGMNGVRINTAYGNIDQYKRVIDNVRSVADIPILIDIKGPEVRIKSKKTKKVFPGEIIAVGFDENQEVSFTHDFFEKIDVGDVINIDNNKIHTRVTEKKQGILNLQVLSDGVIADGKGVNIPNKNLMIPTLSAKDIEIVDFSIQQGVEYIALSFTRNAQDIDNLRNQAKGFKGGIIAKIEDTEGVEKIDEILEAADGIMVARGDLGIEIAPERVPLVQKSIILRCNQRAKIVITATEMLESMLHNPLPTRAEVSDVANAILDGTDVVMLSGETAIGHYPVEAVNMMSSIAMVTEDAVISRVESIEGSFFNISDAVSKAIQRLCQNMPIDKVVTLTRSGYTAKVIARFRIKQPIIAVTPDKRVKTQLELLYGVYPVQIDYQTEKDLIRTVANNLSSLNLVNKDEVVLFTAGVRTQQKHAS
ncbi:MAG: pyruvate kinase, partial [Crenarchaeota archaeon]|nr:pyruvate kinase [Thermoproteota archaeon]